MLPYVAGWGSSAYGSIFGPNYRLYPQFLRSNRPVPNKLLTFLRRNRLTLDNYRLGTAVDRKGRTILLSRVLLNSEDQRFEPITRPLVVISRHPWDVTGRSFSGTLKNCTGYRPIRPSLIAYLLEPQDLNRPVACMSLIPVRNQRCTTFLLGIPYGRSTTVLVQQVRKWVESLKAPDGDYLTSTGKKVSVRDNRLYEPVPDRQTLAGLEQEDHDSLLRIAGDPNTPSRTLALMYLYSVRTGVALLPLLTNPNTPTSTLTQAASNPMYADRSQDENDDQ